MQCSGHLYCTVPDCTQHYSLISQVHPVGSPRCRQLSQQTVPVNWAGERELAIKNQGGR